jgi:hypothetical protein
VVSGIASLRDRAKGKPALLLANGPSLERHAPSGRFCSWPGITVGMNRSWMVHPADLHVVLEADQVTLAPGLYKYLASRGRLVAQGMGPDQWPEGTILLQEYRASFDRWSWDLTQGAVSGWEGAGSVAYVALQLAVWMGCRPVYFVGLDLGGPKFDGSSACAEGQSKLFDTAAKLLGDYPVYIVGDEGRCTTWPRVSWKEIAA